MSWKHLVTCGQALVALAAAQKLVDDKALTDAVTIDNLLAHAQALEDIAYASPGANRVVSSEGHNNTIKYIVDQLEALGGYYDVVLEPFNTTLQLSGNGSLTVNGVLYETTVLDFSPSVSVPNATIVPVANLGCDASDYPAAVAGSIALVSRGTCSFRSKAELVKAAGGVAGLIYNNAEGLFNGTFQGVSDTAAMLALSRADGLALLAELTNGTTPLYATMEVSTEIATGYSNNIIATTTYETNSTDILVLGAHSDSVAAGPGINDDGSGTVGILETAIQLAKGKYTAVPSVRFAWWTAEELGLLGSTQHVATLPAEELTRVRLYLNFDMIASPNYILGILDGDASTFPPAEGDPSGVPGSGDAEAVFAGYFSSLGLPSNSTELAGNSDYGPFQEVGIPITGLDAGAGEIKTEEQVALWGGTAGVALDPNYHTPADNITNLSPEVFEVMSKAIAHAVAHYGVAGFDNFPPRNTSALLQQRARKDVRPKLFNGGLKKAI